MSLFEQLIALGIYGALSCAIASLASGVLLYAVHWAHVYAAGVSSWM